jgi:glycosyltransferase involved in cell wall biosynthesis
MLHIYRQVTGLRRYRTFVIAKERREAERYPFADVERVKGRSGHFVARFMMKYVRRLPPLWYRGELPELLDLLRRRPAALMHVYFGHTGVHLLPFIETWDRPVVVSFHGADVMPRDHQAGYGARLAALLERVPLVLARSHSLFERLIALGCPEGKLRLNRTGIPVEPFRAPPRTPPADGAWRVVQASRLIEKKGFPTTLRAFAGFRARYPAARLDIAGEGPLRETLERLAGELRIADSVTFRGFISQADLARLFAESHFFMHPSETTSGQDQEGVPNSMLEAMASGLPVIATRHGGIPEAVEDGANGLLVEEGDAAATEAAMLRLAGTPGLLAEIGNDAVRSVTEAFGQESQIVRLESYYDEALDRAIPRE